MSARYAELENIANTCCTFAFDHFGLKNFKESISCGVKFLKNIAPYPDGWYEVIGISIGTPLNYCPQCGATLNPDGTVTKTAEA
jgi:hypothetical protein